MTDYVFFFLIFLAVVAAVLRSDFVLTLIYLLLGIFVLGRWWGQRALAAVSLKRVFNSRLFLGEKATIRVEIANNSLLPVVWLQVHESFPSVLGVPGFFRQVVSLGPHARTQLEYEVEGRRRGYYQIGPMLAYSGDLFGLAEKQGRWIDADYLTVYPKIVPLMRIGLPSSSPLGTLRHKQPIFEDPSRVLGKRDYVSGDSLRRVDWKSTATTGRLQVKIFEPSIALETMVFLSMNTGEYPFRTRTDISELAVVVAASVANWVVSQRQSVGLAVSGQDPVSMDEMPQVVPPRRGRAHLMRILETLARVQLAESARLVDLIRQQYVHLSWGTTLIVIGQQFDHDLFDALFQARRSGLNAVLIPCGPLPGLDDIRRRAENFGFPLFHVFNEKDLDQWRG